MRVVRAASLFTSVLVALLMAANASARDIQLKIDSPRANAKVGNEVSVKTRVRAGRRSHRLSYYVDGKRVVTTRSRSSTNSRRSYGLDTSGLDRGRHRIRVVAEVGGRRASKSVRVFVEPQTSKALAGESVAPVAIPGTELFPTGSAKDFELIFADDFTKPAALGTMGSDSDPNKIVYTGTTGTRWRTYPRTYLDTFQRRPYRSDQVLSVQDGNLDFWLHNVDGQPAGANPSPVLPDGTQYQTYGRYSARIKVDATDLSEYKVAWLLWPKDEQHWASAESDFPEGPLVPGRAGATAYAHYAPGQFETGTDPSVDMHEWHTYTQDWTPLVRRYYVDGRLIHTTVNPVWSGPMRWQLQTETDGYGNNSGHLKVDWVAVYSYAPGTPPSA
ncbi:MAG: glycoside hydrolase family 16 protein [Thermoleophilaceae bacterium]|nr:glycoside hydrolase family 16 protein [Thermoleophilaceae bacterium]